MGSAVGVRALPGVVLMGGGGRKVVSRASQHVVGADFGECNVCSAEAGWRCRSELYGSAGGVLAKVLSRIEGAMIADRATATTPVENATGRERERVVERAGSTSKVADGGPKDLLASNRPSEHAFEGDASWFEIM